MGKSVWRTCLTAWEAEKARADLYRLTIETSQEEGRWDRESDGPQVSSTSAQRLAIWKKTYCGTKPRSRICTRARVSSSGLANKRISYIKHNNPRNSPIQSEGLLVRSSTQRFLDSKGYWIRMKAKTTPAPRVTIYTALLIICAFPSSMQVHLLVPVTCGHQYCPNFSHPLF